MGMPLSTIMLCMIRLQIALMRMSLFRNSFYRTLPVEKCQSCLMVVLQENQDSWDLEAFEGIIYIYFGHFFLYFLELVLPLQLKLGYAGGFVKVCLFFHQSVISSVIVIGETTVSLILEIEVPQEVIKDNGLQLMLQAFWIAWKGNEEAYALAKGGTLALDKLGCMLFHLILMLTFFALMV